MQWTTAYQNKYVSILGDSISTFGGYSQPKDAAYYDTACKIATGISTSVDTWWGQVIERLGAQLLINNSWSGSTVCNHESYQVPSYACSNERTSSLSKNGQAPDVIFVFMGVNDWGAGFPIVGDGAEKEYAFSFAYQTMLKKLRDNYPKAEIICLTLPVSCCTAAANFQFPYFFAGRHIIEYCNSIRENATQCGCRVIDLYNCAPPYDTIDGIHPNASGMKTLAAAILQALNE